MKNALLFLLLLPLMSCSAWFGVGREEAQPLLTAQQQMMQTMQSQTQLLDNLVAEVTRAGVPAAQISPIAAASKQNLDHYKRLNNEMTDLFAELMTLDYKTLWQNLRNK